MKIIRKSINLKVMLSVSLLMSLLISAIIASTRSSFQSSVYSQYIASSKSLTEVADEVRAKFASLSAENAFDNADLIARLHADIAAGKSYRDSALYDTVPIVAAWSTIEQRANEVGLEFRLPKIAARNPRNEARPGLEQAVIKYLQGQGTIEEIESNNASVIYPPNPEQARESGEIAVLYDGVETLN